MTKELEELKKELSKAGSENDVLAALDGLSRELTDEEVMSIFGGIDDGETGGETGSTVGEKEDGSMCPGEISGSCVGKCIEAKHIPWTDDYFCEPTGTSCSYVAAE